MPMRKYISVRNALDLTAIDLFQVKKKKKIGPKNELNKEKNQY